MASVSRRPSLSGQDKEALASAHYGRNTLISHGGRWHNLKEPTGVDSKRDADSRITEEPNSGRGHNLNSNGEHRRRSEAYGQDENRTIFNTKVSSQGDYENASLDGGNDDLNGIRPGMNGMRHVELEVPNRAGDSADYTAIGVQMSPEKILELAGSPFSLPTTAPSMDLDKRSFERHEYSLDSRGRAAMSSRPSNPLSNGTASGTGEKGRSHTVVNTPTSAFADSPLMHVPSLSKDSAYSQRPQSRGRTVSSPSLRTRISASKGSGTARDATTSATKQRNPIPTPLRFEDTKAGSRLSAIGDPEPSSLPTSIPVPPLSLPTYLQLELSSHNPSPLYIHRPITTDFPYESSHVKLERLLNFLYLPPQLEQVLWFGALACLDSWLYTFTILPLRFLKALSILGNSWGRNLVAEARFVGWFIYTGIGRMWRRKRRASAAKPSVPEGHQSDTDADTAFVPGRASFETSATRNVNPKSKPIRRFSAVPRHRTTKSAPSALLPDHKADILKALLIIISCVIMMYFDPSRMYHGIRGQAAIKLYVIYNVLEVCDRLFSALGQDVLECLFSKETLERKSDGRSKILRPFWLFILALAYNLIHATALFYQVITLNVAVNSYSNALLTLLMSNQFVEIKSTVFKKFEKENLFQITCADVVERFQLWLMLTIIASRNIVETGSLMPTSSSSDTTSSVFLPKAFTLELIPFLSGQIIGPYLIVLGSEMLVDWIKHAYITKFNMTKPAIYGRFLDVLCKDYYSNAFATQNLTRRLGLPVIPLACLFIRASVQTYHMFIATHVPSSLPPSSSAATSIAVPAPTAILPEALNNFLNNLLPDTPTHIPFTKVTPDALLSTATTVLVFLLLYLTLLALKLLLGIALLHFARNRFRGMKEHEGQSFHADGRRIGGWGVVEIDEDKKRWIYADDAEGLRKSNEREKQGRKKAQAEGGGDLGSVERYSMCAKRIW